MHIWKCIEECGVTHWVTATTGVEATAFVEDMTGNDHEWESVEQLPDDQPFSVTEVDEPGQPITTKLPAEWYAEFGTYLIAIDGY